MLLRTTLTTIALFALAACSVSIPNIKQPDFQIPKNVPKNELQARFDSVTTFLNKTQKLHQAMFEERSRGTDYSETMKLRLEKTVVVNRILAENVVELYSGCTSVPRTYTEIVGRCKDFALKVFNASKTSDELYQLLLGYTYAGLEKNPAFLTDRNEKRVNELIKKQYTLNVAVEKPLYVFAKMLQQTKCCDISPQKYKMGKPDISFSSIEENETTRRLAYAIQKASKNTVLVERPTTIIIKVAKLDLQDTGDQVVRTLTMAVIGLPIFGLPGSGGNATASANVSVQGENYKLNLNTFDMNVRDQDTLIKMLANRIVGAAHYAVLDSIIAKQ